MEKAKLKKKLQKKHLAKDALTRTFMCFFVFFCFSLSGLTDGLENIISNYFYEKKKQSFYIKL